MYSVPCPDGGVSTLWPGGPQATAGWHCPERPGSRCLAPFCSLEPSPRSGGGEHSQGPPQSSGRALSHSRLRMDNQGRVTSELGPQIQNHSPAPLPATPASSTGRDSGWVSSPRLPYPAWLGPHTPLSPPALLPDQEEGRDREFGMQSSGTVLSPSGGPALPVPVGATPGAGGGGGGRAQEADCVVC